MLEHQRRNRGRQVGHSHTYDAERELNPVLLRASDQARQFGESIHRYESLRTQLRNFNIANWLGIPKIS